MSFLWDKLPSYIRWPILGALFLIWTPIKVYNGAKDFVHSEVHAYITPLKEIRDMEMLTMKNDIATIKEDSRWTRNFLINYRNKSEK